MMKITRIQHAVGQGGFHSAEIEGPKGTFRYIYDCGSRKKELVKGCIRSLAWTSKSKEYDLLVISSFDSDHFNGVGELLTAGFSFKTVILPHRLDAALFKFILVHNLVETGEVSEIGIIVEILSRMSNGDFGRVLPGEDSNGQRPVDRQDSLFDDTEFAKQSTNTVSRQSQDLKDVNWMLRFYSIEFDAKQEIDDILNLPALVQLKTIIDQIAQSLHTKIDVQSMKELLDEIEVELQKKYDSKSGKSVALATAPATVKSAVPLQALPKAKRAGKTTSAIPYMEMSVKDILAAEVTKLRKKYDSVDDYNSASLCMYSGPQPRLTNEHSSCFEVERVCLDNVQANNFPDPDTVAVGWLGVGDITFKNSPSLDKFARNFMEELPLVSTCMVPHHGAQSNYDADLVQLRRLAGAISEDPLWVAAANPMGGYRHPDGAIVAECQRSGTFHLVSADSMTALIEHVIWKGRVLWRHSFDE